MKNLIDLEKIFIEIEKFRNNHDPDSELNWKDYEFGKNFYLNVYYSITNYLCLHVCIVSHISQE